MSLSEDIHDATQRILAATGQELPTALNGFAGRLLEPLFKSESRLLRDREGTQTARFSSVIYASSATLFDDGAIPADSAAAVIDASEQIDLENLRAAYGRVAQAKTLRKSRVPEEERAPRTTITLGIIVALRSTVPLETLAEELDRLNLQTPGRCWPDIVVVASTGAINYAVQFPSEEISGDFLPPGEGAVTAYTAPVYVVMVMRPTGARSMNKMIAFLIAHLAFFLPGAQLPPWSEVLKGVSQHAVTFTGYQYNQRGDLLPVPREFYNDRYLAPAPFQIEDQQGHVLSTLRFLPWQDGAAILLRGKLPLEGLLPFLGGEAMKRAGVIHRPGAQISYVMPITETDFGEMLRRIQRQSNMVVRRAKAEFVVQKIADEGSRSPFVARLIIGVLRLRDSVFPDEVSRDGFDKAHEFVMSSLFSARDASRRIIHVWEEHARRVVAGEVARRRGPTIQVDESIDRELGQQTYAFLNAATRALKTGMQDLAAQLHVDIGFLFQKEAAFELGLTTMSRADAALADYLRHTRAWSAILLARRNAVEHEGWTLPRVSYAPADGGVRASQPRVTDQPVSAFVTFMFDRLICFVEEVTAYCLQKKMPAGITLTELTLAGRLAEVPERFKITVAIGGMPSWSISFHATPFEET